jgi:hypothetical protein
MPSRISRWMEQCKQATLLLHLVNPTKAVEVRELLVSLSKVKILRDYILDMRMLSGSYLLASPKSPSMFVENMERLPAGVYLEKPGGGRFSTTTRIQRTWTRCAGRQRTR